VWFVWNRSLDELGNDYVGVESQFSVASCVLSFSSSGIGHVVADRCVEELRTNFRGNIWGHNGPGLITRVLLKMCNSANVSRCPFIGSHIQQILHNFGILVPVMYGILISTERSHYLVSATYFNTTLNNTVIQPLESSPHLRTQFL
jgi:hypothetical protein